MRRLLATVRRTIAAVFRTDRPLAYRVLSGSVAADVAAGRLIRTGDILDRLGIQLPDGQQSWYGRHVAKAYRARTGAEPLRVWAQHRTSGRWVHVCVYQPTDTALFEGLRSYEATRNLIPVVTLAA